MDEFRFKIIKEHHEKFWNNWDMPFSKNQYANWKLYDVNDIQLLLEEIARLQPKLKLVKK